MPKRRKSGDESLDDSPITKKSRKAFHSDGIQATESSPLSTSATASTRKSILKKTPSKLNGYKSVEATPSSLRKVLFTGSSEPLESQDQDSQETPLAVRNDRSAHKKSQQALQRKGAEGVDSGGEEDGQDEAVATAILEEEEDDDDDEEDEDEDTIGVAQRSIEPGTPSKAGRPRGRPKGRRRERTPSPPPDLPPHELYFFQNRAGGNKTSVHTMSSHVLLNHDDYFAQMKGYKDQHSPEVEQLDQLHKRSFNQWLFELEEGFGVCLYGYGSKRNLVMDFAEHVYHQAQDGPKIVVVNGYARGLTIRDVLTTIASVVLPRNTKLPAQPPAMLSLLLSALNDSSPRSNVYLIIHSLDHANLRKPTTQAILASLAAHSRISLISSCDTLNFPLLWDVSLSKQFRFLFHDVTTFRPYNVEIDTVEDVNALLGRSGRRFGGKDGVGYVLKSLPENARSLFRILVAEQLALVEAGGDATLGGYEEVSDNESLIGVEDEEAAAAQHTPSKRGRGRPAKKAKKPAKLTVTVTAFGVEYRTLYHKAVEEFVCSSEVNFRTLLKEFHDHQMIESRKDGLGTERLIVPFRKEELEAILEELV